MKVYYRGMENELHCFTVHKEEGHLGALLLVQAELERSNEAYKEPILVVIEGGEEMKYISEENDGEFVDVDAIVAQIDYEADEEDSHYISPTGDEE